MPDKKVKISNILGSQIPDFIQADNPLFKEFLTQYYASEEREYGTTYLADNIASLKKISTVSDISLVEKQTVPVPNSTSPEKPVLLKSLVYAYDDEITVNRGEGFPEKYGLLKIDDEIITYTGKTKNLTNISIANGNIDREYDTIISGITTTNINIDDIVSLYSVTNQELGELKTISILEGTRVSDIGTNTITVDRPIYSTSALRNVIKTFTHDGSFKTNRTKFGKYVVEGQALTGNGSGSSFEVTIPETGTPTVTLINSGKNYGIEDTIILSNISEVIIVTVSEIINLNYISITSENLLEGQFTFTRESFTFTGCARGFSGVSAIETLGNPEFLTFSETNANSHDANSLVTNLSFLFVTQFYKKFRKHFLPGLEGKSFSNGLNVENILSRARDFYSSKGTDTSLKILFQVLYGELVDIIKPFNQTILPSDAEWDVTDDIIVENIDGNPLNLVGLKIYQDSFTNPTASGAVANVEAIYLKSKKYFKISFSKGTITNKFKVSTKTKVVAISPTREVTTVDSTIGFGDSGNFYYLNEDNKYTLATYTSKSNNQFFGCTGISRTLIESDPIIDTNFIYGYENNDLTKICTMRTTGSISGVSDNANVTKYFDIGDTIGVKHLGEEVDIDDPKFNTWFYNNLSYIDIANHDGSESFTTEVNHNLKKGDRIDIILKSNGTLQAENVEVKDVNTPNKFSIESNLAPNIFGDYQIRKKISYIDDRFGISSLLGNIQNTFIDNEENTYVSFSGYPSFETSTTNRSKIFNSSSGVSTSQHTLNINDHNFINGEKVYLKLGEDLTYSSGSGITGISTGFYFVNVINSNTIKLATTPLNLYRQLLEIPKYIGTKNDDITGINTIFKDVNHTITPANLYENEKLQNQENFKRIYKNPKISTENTNIKGAIGVSLNGIEYHSPISKDSLYYGQINEIEILNSGNDYDVVNPPTLSIVDLSGNSCVGYGNFSGSISDIVINNKGFDYTTTPSVTISGGNGSGARCEAKMRGFTYSKAYTDFNVDLTTNVFDGEHRFLNGEEVVYTATGNPIGIDTGVNVGFNTDLLSSGASYFISKKTDSSFSLAIKKDDAISGINTIFFIQNGNGTHIFKSKKIRKIIDTIKIVNAGSLYSNRKVNISSQQYPTVNRSDLFKTFVGINTFNNYIFAKNHNFRNGDNVEYSCTETAISGLSTSKVYKITVIDNDKFKLSDAGTISTVTSTNYNRKIFESLNDVGVGTHTFKYPEIKVNISNDVSIGLTSVMPDYYKGSAEAKVKGKVENIFIENGGVGYGVTNIINYSRQPNVSFLTGRDAILNPVIANGSIVNVVISNSGSEYTSPPDLEVVGLGTGIGSLAKLKAVISEGKITDVKIIEEGSGYTLSETFIKITPSGRDAKFSTKIYNWKINSVERYKSSLDSDNQLLQLNSELKYKGNKICSFYPPDKYIELLTGSENIDATTHSKIVGWAYDGNPIYGPISNDNVGTGLTFIESSYNISPINDINYRPPQTIYPNGYFIEDYIYDESGDLDEYNGKFTITPEYPNGTYAYFSTVDKFNFKPTFPYTTFKHRNSTDTFNYNLSINQSDLIINNGNYKRNVTHLGLNETFKKYPILEDSLNSKVKLKVDGVKSSNITKISVDESGENYKVDDQIRFSDPTITSRVSEVLGKEIISVATTNTTVNNLSFSISDENITGLSTIPHGLLDGDVVEITGISSTKYKNIEGVKIIGVSTVTSSISTSIANSSAGISTFVTFSDSTISRKFNVNDIVKIGTEELLIIDHDDVNNKHRVIRGHNSTTPTDHDSGSVITRLETEFTYTINKKLENKNIEFPKVEYFEAEKSVGIGTSFTNVIVGRVGTNLGVGTIFKSVPPKAIFLPNHKFKSGDELSLVSLGSTIIASKNVDLSNQFDLSSFDKLFCVKINNDFIGLSTEKVGFSTNNVFFKQIITGSTDNAKLELITNNVIGQLRKVNGTVTVATATTTGQQHGLSVGDKFKLDIKSNRTETFNLKYNENIRKLVVNPISFNASAIGIGTTVSKITINNHNFETGDVIVYNSTDPATPLVDNGVYYVIKDSLDTIRLAENSYDISTFPYNYIGIGTTGAVTHEISKINPKLDLYKDSTVELITSDSSLTDYEIDFYNDPDFISQYNSSLISKNGVNGDGDTATKIIISVGGSLSEKFYYRVVGKGSNFVKTISHFANTDVPNHSQIKVLDSKFNIEHKVVSIGTSTFNFNPVGIAETDSYTTVGFSSAFYSTKSKTELGGIHSIDILNKGFNVSTLPILTSIGTTTGKNAVLSIETDKIGEIDSTKTIIQGIEFTPDKTLQPKAESNLILELKNVFTLKSIGVTTGGIEYTTPPNVTVVGNPNIVAQTTLGGSAVRSVDILQNDTGINEDVRIVPINNSNGIVVKGAETASNGIVTLELRAPNPETGSGDSGFFNQGSEFPFKTGDEIFVENIKILNDSDGLPTGDGFNSSDYNYTYFTVTGVNTTGGNETISYSISGVGSTGGTYQQDNNFGRVIKKNHLASFNAEFNKVSFFDKESISVLGKDVSGVVAENGWDPESETLKVFNVNGEFLENDVILGSQSNNKSTVENTFKFDFDLNVDSAVEIENGWKQETGKLNSSIQNLHDNDYYQRFSYSIKGTIPFLTWKNSVDSLDHVAGFKNFCNLGIHSVGTHTLKSDSLIEFDVDIDQEASVHDKFYYDLVSENTTDSSLSKLVTFDSKIITDYNESITNKVFLIDDISSQFTGIVTSTGGGVIGTTSFDIFTDGESVFHKTFDPATGINTSTHLLTITKHEFNTGEELIYKPEVGQSAIGIANTSDVNAGVSATTILPSTVFVIREDQDSIKVAISATFANAGIAVSFVDVEGIGNSHTLSVPSENATIRSLISIDNVIQSPLGITTAISVGLASTVGVGSTSIFLNDVSEIEGKSLLRIQDEIFKVNLVGVGSTNILVVDRGQMGTVAAAHTVGAAVTVLKGDYRINEGRLYFSEAPYGPKGISDPESTTNPDGVTTLSTFAGRAYYRLNYDTNRILDDISDRFDGSTDKFNLTSNGVDATGISSSFGAILINNIFQKPYLGIVGDSSLTDYTLVGTGQTIDFTGTNANKDLPRGGIINEFDVGIGSGYQFPRKAIFSAVVSNSGTIQSVGIVTGGAGYLSNPLVSISSTIGVGAAFTAFVTAGIVTSITINNVGSGYTNTGISTGLNFITVSPPSPYKDIPLTGGNGSGATIDVVVGTGGSIISFDMANRGIGYEIGDNLELSTIPFQVGAATSAFNITVKNKYQDKFAGWCFGQLLELDDFSIQFNGFRKSFLITRTTTSKEFYSIVAQKGSGIILQNNLLIFINDILQTPGEDYIFNGGTRITFNEAPKRGSKFRMYFYAGSSIDFDEIDVDETIKPGDELRLQKYFGVPEQDNRVIYALIASDTVETQTYSGVGISTNTTFLRPTVWRKQTQDLTIDGLRISKERNYLEPKILPTSGIIKSISPSDTRIYIKDSWAFSVVDGVQGNLNNINIVGIESATPKVESVGNVTYNGDYGDIIGIGTQTTGINTTGPALFFDLKPDSTIFPANISSPTSKERLKTGIETGDYFVIQNTFIGSSSNGTTGIKTTSSGPETIGVGTNFLDNVYFAEHIVGIGQSVVRVFSNVQSIIGINTVGLTTYSRSGKYSWGAVNVSRGSNSKSFEFFNQNGLLGIETSAQVIRSSPIKTSYT